jgi:hypothetical protein
MSITKQMGGLTPTLVLLFVNAAHYGIEMGQVAQVGQVGPSDRSPFPCPCIRMHAGNDE